MRSKDGLWLAGVQTGMGGALLELVVAAVSDAVTVAVVDDVDWPGDHTPTKIKQKQ